MCHIPWIFALSDTMLDHSANARHRRYSAIRLALQVALLGVSTTILATGSGEPALKATTELSPHSPGQTSKEERQLLRVEATAAITRGDEARMVDDMLSRIGRIETITRDLKRLIEAFPSLTSVPPPPAAPPSVPAPTLSTSPMAKPLPSLPIAIPDEQAAAFPVSLPVAGGVAGLLLLLGLLWRRSRHSNRPAPSPANLITSNSLPLPGSPFARSAEPSRPIPATPVVVTLDQGATAIETTPITHVATASVTAPAPASAFDLVSENQHGTIEFSSPPADRPSWATEMPASATSPAADEAGYDQTLELAEIMLSMGLTGGAAQALSDHISTNPRQALVHWMKLLEIYRKDGHRADFDRAAREMQQSFNIQAAGWLNGSQSGIQTLEDFPRVSRHVQELWQKPQECTDYLTHLLEDNREGMRAGFPQPVAEEMLLLIAVLKNIQLRG